MKVIHTVGSIADEASGPSYSVPALANALGERQWDVSVFSVGPTAITQNQYYLHRRFANRYGNWPVIRKLQSAPAMRAALLQTEPDIIHNHGLWLLPNFYGAQVKNKIKAKLVYAPRGMISAFSLSFSPIRKKLFSMLGQRVALEAVDLFHATSEQEYHEIRAYGYKQPVAIIANGIDFPQQTNAVKKTKREVLYVGRIHPKKRLSDLILAWAKLEKDFPQWCLRIIGPGELNEIAILQALIQHHHVQNIRIDAPLYGPDKSAAYATADLFVLPTGNENFAMTVAEALVHGVPVISTKGAPWAGLVTNRCGWWCEIGAEPLEKTMRSAMQLSQPQLKKMGQNGRSWMARDFGWTGIAAQMTQAYAWVLGGTAQPSHVRID